jgi:hypothetical protein
MVVGQVFSDSGLDSAAAEKPYSMDCAKQLRALVLASTFDRMDGPSDYLVQSRRMACCQAHRNFGSVRSGQVETHGSRLREDRQLR